MPAVNTLQFLLEADLAGRQIARARVVVLHDDGRVSATDDGGAGPVRCDVLQTADGSTLRLAVGDTVLLWRATPEDAGGVVLGRIGPTFAPAPEPARGPEGPEEIVDELVIEAKKQLTLRVGHGTITIREDGKILIKGKDLISHAQRVNRIKGGTVSIN